MPKKKLPRKVLLAYIAILVTTIIWAAAGPIIKYTLDFIPPLTFLFLRFLIVCVVLLPYMFIQLNKVKIDKKDYLTFFILGILSQSSLALYFIGLNMTKVLDAAIIGIMGSLMTVAAGHYFYNDKVNTKVKWGLSLASLGTLLVILEPALSGNGNVSIEKRILGNLIILSHFLLWTIFVIWSKTSTGKDSEKLKKVLKIIELKVPKKDYPPTLITTFSFYVGLLTLIPLAFVENMRSLAPFDILYVDPRAILGLLYMALLSSIVAYICYQWSLDHIRVSDVSFFGYLGTLFTIPFAYIILGEIPNEVMIIGSVIIAIGVYIAEKQPK